MWIFALGLSGIILLSCTGPGKSIFKIGKALYETVSDKITHKNKKIELISVNSKPAILYENLIFPAFKQKHSYDINCFYSDDKQFIEDITHRQTYINEDYIEIDMNIIKHGIYSSMIPFRPLDYGYEHLLVSVKKINEDTYSVYKFNSSEYINIYDIYEKYNKDTEDVKEDVQLAEAFD